MVHRSKERLRILEKKTLHCKDIIVVGAECLHSSMCEFRGLSACHRKNQTNPGTNVILTQAEVCSRLHSLGSL